MMYLNPHHQVVVLHHLLQVKVVLQAVLQVVIQIQLFKLKFQVSPFLHHRLRHHKTQAIHPLQQRKIQVPKPLLLQHHQQLKATVNPQVQVNKLY